MREIEEQLIQSRGKSISSVIKDMRQRYLESILHSGGVQIIACIPAYKEEKSIASVILKTREHVDLVVVCDDGSDDMTGDIAETFGCY